MDATDLFDATRERMMRLSLEKSVAVALACAQRLAEADGDADPVLLSALAAGWDQDAHPPLRESIADALERRDDVDEDAVASTVYALRAADGSAEDAWWAVSRFLDAVFSRADYGAAAPDFRSLNDDAGRPEVQSEIRWLDRAIRAAEATDDPGDLATQLREL